MGRPPWRYVPTDGQLHLIRREVHDVAEALCPLRVTVAELREPDDEDQPRCHACIRIYGAMNTTAEQMFDPAYGLLSAVARSTTRQETTAAAPEQVDLVIELGALARAIVEHNRRVMAREPVKWAELSEALSSAARSCRGQVVLDLGDGVVSHRRRQTADTTVPAHTVPCRAGVQPKRSFRLVRVPQCATVFVSKRSVTLGRRAS